MLVQYTSLKSIAKILLLLMMPGGKAPDNTPLSLQTQMAVQYLMAQGPIVTEYGRGYLLQFYGSETSYLISAEQMDQIRDSMSNAEKNAVFNERMDISFSLAAYIVQKGYVPLELPDSSSHSNSSSLYNAPSSLATNQYNEDYRRAHAPTLFEALQDTFKNKNITCSIGFTPAPRGHQLARPIQGRRITLPPGTIKEYKQRGDIKMLLLTRDRLLAAHNKWFPSENYYDIKNQLIEAEQSLIDLGHIEYPQLQKMREIAKRGDLDTLQARYKRVCELIMDKSWFSGKLRKKEGTARLLWLEKRYLENIKNNPLVAPLKYVAIGEGPELQLALTNLYKEYYCAFSADSTWYEKHAGFNIIETAHSYALKHPNGAQIIAAAQRAFTKDTGISLNTNNSSSSSSTSAATTTASTGEGTTASTSTPSPMSSSSSSTYSLLTRPVQDSIIESLNTCHDVGTLADQLGLISHDVFSYAQHVSYDINPEVQDHIELSIDTIRTTQDEPTIVFHVSYVERILTDIQSQIQPQQAQQPTLLERSPQLLTRALEKFITGLNPVTQVKNAVEFWVSTAHFVADVTVGKLYLTAEQYDQRIKGFWNTIEAMSPSNLVLLSAEQWVDILGQMAADAVYAKGLSSTIAYLKEIDAVAKAQRKVSQIASKMVHAMDDVIGKNPLAVTTDGLVMRMSNDLNNFATGAKEIIKDSRALLESSYGKFMLQLEAELVELRPLFEATRKGFGTFANKNIKINYKHILGMDIKFYPNKIDFSGFHHDLMGAIEKSGLVQFTNKFIDETGVYSADVIVNGIKYEKTLFPALWSRKQVIEAICEVYDNFKHQAVKQSSGKWLVEGVTTQGVKIRMFVTENGVIKSAYPFLK